MEAMNFWDRVLQGGPDECWPFQGRRYKKYGILSMGHSRRHVLAHRHAFELANGRPAKDCVLHSCDNPPCCNPAHLREGTNRENVSDRVMRGKNGKRATGQMVKALRDMYRGGGIGTGRLAKVFGLSQTTTLRIIARQTWRYVD